MCNLDYDWIFDNWMCFKYLNNLKLDIYQLSWSNIQNVNTWFESAWQRTLFEEIQQS